VVCARASCAHCAKQSISGSNAGARHALIGPNGAGKTSFVELVTGALRPNAATSCSTVPKSRRWPQAARVKRGLVRTFQITALFRRLSVLENVTLEVCERQGVGGGLFRPSGRYRAAIEEAFALVSGSGLPTTRCAR